MGWGYADWSGVFYPAAAASKEYLALYARTFDAVEIDSTFYGTPREAQIQQWARATPPNFVFCPKVPRVITHEMRLVGAAEEIKRFVAVMGLLGPKLGPMLLQFPPDFTRAALPQLQAILPVLRELAPGERDAPGARFAVEFRHRSLLAPDVSALLAEHNVALANADYAPMPKRFEITSDFLYLRLIGRHGAFPHHRAAQSDRAPDLERWAGVLRENQARFPQGAWIFCNNDYEGYSPQTADTFKRLLGLPVAPPPPPAQGSLF